MVPPRRPPGDNINGSGKRDSSMSQRKDGGSGKGDAKTQNGARSGFRTDTAISNSRSGGERVLKRWVPDAPADNDGSLEKSSSKTGEWDQFAANERLFGLKTDYNENFYTTAIDKSHPQYTERLATAEKKAREIEKSAATTAHVAEERVMDFDGDGKDEDEEDKYSGVRRQPDFPPLSSSGRDNKYTPPARRAPTGHSTVVGAPVDPAIIMSQVKGGPASNSRMQFAPKSDEQKGTPPITARPPTSVVTPLAKVTGPKVDNAVEKKLPDKKTNSSASNAKLARPTSPANGSISTSSSANAPGSGSSASTSLRPVAATPRSSLSPNAKPSGSTSASSVTNSPTPSSAADGVEKALLKEFKNFASQERLMTDKIRQNKMKADQQVRLLELKKFAKNFKLTTPVPSDLIPIIAKDPAKQKQIQEKALQNVEELAKTKVEPKQKETTMPVATASKASSTSPSSGSGAGAGPSVATHSTVSGLATDKVPHSNTRLHGSVHGGSPSVAGRHSNARNAPYMQQSYRQQSQPYRGDRSGQHMSQGPSTGHLAERLRNNMDQNRYPKQPGPHGHYNAMGGEIRAPPTGPASSMDSNFSRRLSAVPSGVHAAMAAQKLNPTIHEFRPSPFAASFNPTGPSAGSSPRSAINNVSSDPNHPSGTASATSAGAAATSPRVFPRTPIRRKVNGVDPKKCLILEFVRSIKPPTSRNWDSNDGMRPSYDTAVTWRPAQEDEKPDSTMLLSYNEYFERLAFAAASMVTPLQGHVMPHNMQHMVHPHLPIHLQQQGGHMGLRPGHMAPLPMHSSAGVPHGPNGHIPFSGDDQRMMHSNSAQSYASPRMSQIPLYPQQVGGTPQMAFNQPMMPFVPGTPQMNNYRNYSNTPQQFIPPQSGPMMPMIPPHQFVSVPGGMMPPGQQMPVYAGGHQYMAAPGASGPAGGVAPQQQLGGSNGYPSPGRPVAAPMMAHQGSQQGQHMYGMSPSLQYQQPAFSAQHPGPGAKGPMRGGYNNAGSQQFGTSPQQMHQYGPRNGSGSYGGKNYQNHNSHNNHQAPPQHHGPPKSRSVAEGAEEAK